MEISSQTGWVAVVYNCGESCNVGAETVAPPRRRQKAEPEVAETRMFELLFGSDRDEVEDTRRDGACSMVRE